MEVEAQQKTINVLYIFLIISTILAFVPMAIPQLISLVLVVLVLIAAYIYRAKDNADGLMFNHMTYLIGTIWIGTSFLTIGLIIGGIYLSTQGDMTVLQEAGDKIAAGYVPTEQEMVDLIWSYLEANKKEAISSMIMFVGPAVLYFIYRVANGYSRAMKGYRIANPKSWL